MDSVRCRAGETNKIPSAMLNDALQGSTLANQEKIPTKEAVRKIIQKRRNALNRALPLPRDRASIIMPERYQLYNI